MWKNYAKNVLLLFVETCVLSTAVAVTFIAHGMVVRGLVILFVAAFLGLASESLQYHYWHKSGIHATPLGFIAAWLFFITGIVWLLWHGFFFWIPLMLLIIPIIWGYLTGKNKKPLTK